MALPTAMVQNTLRQAQSGIIVGMTPSTGSPRFNTELQISTQSSTASTAWASVFLNPTTAQYRYAFTVGLSTRSYYFRARHFLAGWSNGPFTATVNAKPVLLPDILQPLMPVLNSKSNVEVLGGDLYLSSAKTAIVGSQQATGNLTKTIRVAHSIFVPETSADRPRHANNYLFSGTTAALIVHGSVVAVPGSRLRSLSMRAFRETTGEAVSATLYRIAADVATQIAAVIITGVGTTGWLTKDTLSTASTFNELVTTTQAYELRVQLTKRAGAGAIDARFQQASIGYTIPKYSVGY